MKIRKRVKIYDKSLIRVPRQCLRDVIKTLILLVFLGENVEFTPLEDRIGRQDVWNDKRFVLKIKN